MSERGEQLSQGIMEAHIGEGEGHVSKRIMQKGGVERYHHGFCIPLQS